MDFTAAGVEGLEWEGFIWGLWRVLKREHMSQNESKHYSDKQT